MEKTFTFTAADDAEDDDGESVKLTFGSALPGGVSRGSVPETDRLHHRRRRAGRGGELRAVNLHRRPKGSGVTVKVKLNAEPERTVDIPLIPTNQGGASDDDYSVSDQRHVRPHGHGEDLHLHGCR